MDAATLKTQWQQVQHDLARQRQLLAQAQTQVAQMQAQVLRLEGAEAVLAALVQAQEQEGSSEP